MGKFPALPGQALYTMENPSYGILEETMECRHHLYHRARSVLVRFAGISIGLDSINLCGNRNNGAEVLILQEDT